MPPGEQLSSRRGRLYGAPRFSVAHAAVQNALARSLANLDLLPPARLNAVAVRWCGTSFGPRAWVARKSQQRSCCAESGVDHSSVDGRTMLQSVKKKLVSCRAPAAVLDRRSAGRPAAASTENSR